MKKMLPIFIVLVIVFFSLHFYRKPSVGSDSLFVYEKIEKSSAAQLRFEIPEPAVYPVSERDSVRVIVIMYHTINDIARSAWSITAEDFEKDLIYLKENGYGTVTISDLTAYENGTGTLPEMPVALTFDDGYASNYTDALALLEKYDACATINVIGSYVTEPAGGCAPTGDQYLDWNQLYALYESGRIEIGHHTWNLHSCSEDGRIGCAIIAGEDEISYSSMLASDLCTFQDALLTHGLPEATCFAYPFGRYCEQSDRLIPQLGFAATLTSVEKVNTITRFDASSLLDLGRYNRPPELSLEAIFARAKF